MASDKLTVKATVGLALALIGGSLALLGVFFTWDRPLDSDTGIFDSNLINVVSGGGYVYIFIVPILAALALGLAILCAASRSRAQGFGIAVISIILFCIILFYNIQYSFAHYKPLEAGPMDTFFTYLRRTTGILLSMFGSFLAIIGGFLAALGPKTVKEGKMIVYQPMPAVSKPVKHPAPVKMQPLPYTQISEEPVSSQKFKRPKMPEEEEITEEEVEEEIPPPPDEEEEAGEAEEEEEEEF